jgi:hypothetical protein
MSIASEDHSWIKEKKSWILTTSENHTGNFEPLDPPTGRWTPEALAKVFGPGDLTLLPLEGKWMSEVLVYATHAECDGGFRNGLAGYLTLQSLGSTHAIFGPVLMTLRDLLEDPPEEKRMTLGELLEWARPPD